MLKDLISGDKIHCIGIGGIGLSGLAQLLYDEGFIVSGSDLEEWDMIEKMRIKDITIEIGHRPRNLPYDCKLVIYSSAVPEDNPEIEKAKKHNMQIVSYAEAVEQFIEKNHLNVIAVCGTHGKTTTTAFSALALLAGDEDPTVLIGSELKELSNGNSRLGRKGGFFVIEACEYKRNFLQYKPDIIVLTNIEAEHLDYFKDEEDYKSAFKEFIEKLPPTGFVIGNKDDDNSMDVLNTCDCKKILFSSKDKKADWFLDDKKIYNEGSYFNDINLNIPGEFNRLNALCGLILGVELGIDESAILKNFSGFSGTWRRFEEIGEFEGMKVISDYAHHPTAIIKTLKAAHEKYPEQNICAIFQPHQYNRTKHFISEFANSFNEAEYVIIPNIYNVRDSKEDIGSVSAEDLVNELRKHKKADNALYISDHDEIKTFLKKNSNNIDIILIMGAGDIWHFAESLV